MIKAVIYDGYSGTAQVKLVGYGWVGMRDVAIIEGLLEITLARTCWILKFKHGWYYADEIQKG